MNGKSNKIPRFGQWKTIQLEINYEIKKKKFPKRNDKNVQRFNFLHLLESNLHCMNSKNPDRIKEKKKFQ